MPSAFSCLGPQRLLAGTLVDFARGAGLELDPAVLDGAACFVARRAEQLIGVLALRRGPQAEASMVWLGVAPEACRQGVARDLLRIGCAWWARQGGTVLVAGAPCRDEVLAALGFAAVQDGRRIRRVD